MHKIKCWNILLALLMCLAMTVPGRSAFAAGAEEVYPVKVGSIQADSLNKDDLLRDGSGRISYDPDTHTLYLNDFQNSSADPDLTIRLTENFADFTIDVSGNCNLNGSESGDYGIAAPGSNVTIKSSDGTGKLSLKGSIAAIYTCNLTIEDIEITGYSPKYGMQLEQNFTMNSGYLFIIGDYENGISSYCEQDQGVFTFSDGKALIYGGPTGISCSTLRIENGADVYSSGLYLGVNAADGVTVDGGYLESTADGEASDGIYIKNENGGIELESGVVKATGSEYGIRAGYLTMTHGELTADGSGKSGIHSYGDVSIKGGTVNSSGGVYGIDCNGSLLVQELGDQTKTEIYTNGDHYGVWAGGDIKVYGGYLDGTGGNGESGTGLYAEEDVYMEGGMIDATGDSVGLNMTNLWMDAGAITASGGITAGIFARGEIDVTGGEISAVGGSKGIYAQSDIIFYEELGRVHAEGGDYAVLAEDGFLSNDAPITDPAGDVKLSIPSARYFELWEDDTGYPVKNVTLSHTVTITYKPGIGSGEDIVEEVPVGVEMSIAEYPSSWTPPENQHFGMWIMRTPYDASFLDIQIDEGIAKYIPRANSVLTAEYGIWVTHYEDTNETCAIRHVNTWGDDGTDYDLTKQYTKYNEMPPGMSVGVTLMLNEEEDSLDSTAYLVAQDGSIITTMEMVEEISSYDGKPRWRGKYTVPDQDFYLRFTSNPIPDTATLSATSMTYNGKARKPKVTIEGLTEGKDFKVAYANNKNAGTATVTITGIGAYGGSYTRNFTILPKSITPTVTVAAVTYNGKARIPSVTVKDGSTTLKEKTDYTVTYASGRKNVGQYKVTVKLKGNYKGSGTAYLKINPKGTTLATATAASKAITVKWKKQAAKMSTARITGYEIQLATNSGFTKNKKTVTVSGYSKTSKKVTGLKGKTKYYIRIRTYKTISGKKYYSPWSKVKTVTTKK